MIEATPHVSPIVLAIPLASPFALLVLHAVLQRILRRAPPQRVAMLSCALGLLPVGAALLLAGVRDVGAVLYVGLTYVCIAYSYFHLFNMSETARRIRLVREIDRHGGLREDQIRQAYSEDEVVDTRLARMAAMGHLVERHGRYFAGSKTLLLAACALDAWRGVLGYARSKEKDDRLPLKPFPWFLPAACALALALPVVLVAMPPMVDFPAHEAVVSVLCHGSDPAYFPAGLYVRNLGHPNELQYLLAWPLAYLIGTTKALAWVVALAVAAVIFGAARLARHLGKPEWVCLLVAPVAVGWNLHWGHIANLLGLGALLWLLPDLDRFAREPRWVRAGGVLAAFLLLYLAHEGALVVAIGALALFSLAYGGGVASFALRAAPCVLMALAASVQLKMQHLTLLNETALLGGVSFPDRVLSMAPTLVGFYDRDEVPYLGAFLLFIATTNGARALLPRDVEVPSAAPAHADAALAPSWRAYVQNHRFFALGLALLGAYFVLPASFNGVFFFFHRFLPIAWCVLVVSTAAPAGAPREGAARLVAMAVPAAMLVFILPAFLASHAAYEELDRLLPSMDRASGVFSVELETGFLRAFNARAFSARNAQGHVVARNGGRALADYTQSPISPALVSPAYAWPEIAALTNLDPTSFLPALVFARFRYVVVHLTSPELAALTQSALAKEARLIAHGAEWLVFESSVLALDSLTQAEPPIQVDQRDTFKARILRLASGRPMGGDAARPDEKHEQHE